MRSAVSLSLVPILLVSVVPVSFVPRVPPPVMAVAGGAVPHLAPDRTAACSGRPGAPATAGDPCLSPALTSLTLTEPSQSDTPALPPATEITATAVLPYRVETPHGVFLGDRGTDLTTLLGYARYFEGTAIGELARDTGLRPGTRKVVFQVYGDETTWNQVTNNSAVWGYFTGQEDRIYLAHWRTPTSTNTVLLTHELFHWLAWEEGRVNLPTWLNEGLAHNESWRIEQGAGTWDNPFVRREWLKVTGNPDRAVPVLDGYQKQDEFVITAAAYLLQSRGRGALRRFFELTVAGKEFDPAFTEAFGTNPAAFDREYRDRVGQLRSGI